MTDRCRQVAMKINDGVYYTPLDPTGTSLTLVDEDGQPAGHLLYDAYGGVLTGTLAPDLDTALTGHIRSTDPDAGLAYLGDGRWYDPALGRPLQPNPVGGPPTVPQALNRYAATSLGAPGVAETASNGLDFLSPAAWTGAFGNTALEIAGRTLSIKSGSLVLEGSAEALAKALQIGEGAPVFGAVAIKPVANRAGVFRAVNREGLGIIEYKGNGRFYFSKFNRTLDTDGVQYVRFGRGALLGEAQALRTFSSAGLTFVFFAHANSLHRRTIEGVRISQNSERTPSS